jgi:hypothetical protein
MEMARSPGQSLQPPLATCCRRRSQEWGLQRPLHLRWLLLLLLLLWLQGGAAAAEAQALQEEAQQARASRRQAPRQAVAQAQAQEQAQAVMPGPRAASPQSRSQLLWQQLCQQAESWASGARLWRGRQWWWPAALWLS